jgi:NRAMP (natural resistance-associated macrophage protein)-like metal ion transporter
MPEPIAALDPEKALAGGGSWTRRLYRLLGPGLITGAADDDPSGIATYSQAGAQFGYSFGWVMLLALPLMAAIQIVSGRIGRTTGLGLSGVLKKHFPPVAVYLLTGGLLLANVINIGADLKSMADATGLLTGLPEGFCIGAFAAFCLIAQMFVAYSRYVAYLKWLTLSLFAYVLTLFVSGVDWKEAALRMVLPDVHLNGDFLTTLVAVLGTTISPYLLFWQAGQEAEEVRMRPRRQPLTERPRQSGPALTRINVDTVGGMTFSNLIALAIMTTAAATLHRQGLTDIQTSTEAAKALAPIAGPLAFALFTLGIIGTGLLAVPVLAGSVGYALAEARGWDCGLSLKPQEARPFYATIAVATIGGMAISFTPVNPIKALYWSAVVNGVIVAPVMAAAMFASSRSAVMGGFAVRGLLLWIGCAATAAMAAAAALMAYFWIV